MATEEPPREPLPPFTEETARIKVQKRGLLKHTQAEDAWNTRQPALVAKAYTPDSEWRNRDLFFNGRDEIEKFLTAKWEKEKGYKLKKELWAYTGNRIAVRFEYEYHHEGQWYRAYGNENWEFDTKGYMQKRFASINDVKIDAEDRYLSV